VSPVRVRLDHTRTRCLGVAESSFVAAERLGRINRACQPEDARIYLERGQDARWPWHRSIR